MPCAVAAILLLCIAATLADLEHGASFGSTLIIMVHAERVGLPGFGPLVAWRSFEAGTIEAATTCAGTCMILENIHDN